MANQLLRFGLPLAITAFLYQAIFKDLIFVVLGVGRHIQSIDEFPYQCRRIEDSRLSACEDMYLSDATRQLFLACSDPLARKEWMPNIARFNHTARSRTDAMIAMDIDSPITQNEQKSFHYRVLKLLNYPSNPHDEQLLHLVGFTGIDSPQTITLLLVNAKPSVDPVTGAFLDQAAVGANSTIEHFITGPKATALKHVATYSHPNINTPNNVATAPGMQGFYMTNDHGPYKTGFMHSVSQLIGRGDISYCDTSTPSSVTCSKLASGISFPNGLLFHPDHNLLYVPSAALGNIHVYRPNYPPGSTMPTLTKIHEIGIPYTMDNLSLDPHTGDIYAAAFPKALDMVMGFNDPMNSHPPAAVFRIRLVQGQSGKLKYEVEKVLEDRGGKNSPLPGTTTVLRDGKTGRLFLSGVFSPYITVCDPK